MPDKEGKLIGRVSHYYGNIGVVIVELSDNLKIGDKIKFLNESTDFDQEINSMEVDYEKVDEASAGSSVGLKVDQRVKGGCQVYKI